MRIRGLKTVPLNSLKENLFVRKQLDQDHVLYLADLIGNGVKMKDPIEVSENTSGELFIVEGRHRKEAYELCEVPSVEVRILDFENESEMISYAYRANTGGSLPPSTGDTEHTVMLLLDRGESKKKIGELLDLPYSLSRKYVNSIHAKWQRMRLQKAAAAVTDSDLTVAQAAEQFQVDPERLKEMLSGFRKKAKKGTADLQKNLTGMYRSIAQKNVAILRGLIEKYEDSDLTEKQVRAIFSHMKQLQRRSSRTLKDWEQRFEALCSPPSAGE